MGSVIRTSKQVSEEKGYPRPEYHRQPLKPFVAGTVYVRPEVALPDGYAKVTGRRIFLVDELGGLHEVQEWELTLAELNGRRVRDPKRLSHLFDPNREKHPGDQPLPHPPTNMRQVFGLLEAKLLSPAKDVRVPVQREPRREE